ncbi:MAG: hypothetical protein AAF609_23855 [Cyanobacteria bacterium P01_C01_bin.120]
MSGRIPPPISADNRRSASVQQRLFRQPRMWQQFNTYRPLVVLASIWVGLLAIALFAYGQLVHTASDTEAANSVANSHPREQRLEGDEGDGAPGVNDADPNQVPPSTDAETLIEQPINGLSMWTLLALVGSCAGGSWLLSMLLKRPRKPKARSPRRSLPHKKYRLASQVKPAQPATTPAADKNSAAQANSSVRNVPRLATYDPQQPLVADPAIAAENAARPAQTVPSQTSVSVVSEQVQHRLDWPQDSLVNTADVRQRRSLSSYL